MRLIVLYSLLPVSIPSHESVIEKLSTSALTGFLLVFKSLSVFLVPSDKTHSSFLNQKGDFLKTAIRQSSRKSPTGERIWLGGLAVKNWSHPSPLGTGTAEAEPETVPLGHLLQLFVKPWHLTRHGFHWMIDSLLVSLS